MRENILFKFLLNGEFLSIDENENTTIHSESIAKREEKLKALLDETQKKEVFHYKCDLIAHMFNIRTKECFKMLYLGIKLGMEVADFCNEEYKELE